MKAKLAMRLLADLMKWGAAEATQEFSWLSLMVEAKYDHYQGYSPGAHFFANLLAWIGQFEPLDRPVAYRFLREHLIFVSQREMHHLVGLTAPIIKERLRIEVASEFGIPLYKTWGNADAELRLKEKSIRTLYVGLSDGAKIDVFRRENEGYISNEQIVAASEISDEKWQKLVDELRTRLNDEGFVESPASFERICLIDDFTASGTTLIRLVDGKWKGKIPTFCDQNTHRVGEGKSIAPNCCIHAHHYLASHRAIGAVTSVVQEFSNSRSDLNFVLTFSSVLPSGIVFDPRSDQEIVQWIKKYYDKSIEDDIVGEDIWFGYKEGGLPLVLYHNTPNNSVALLWASTNEAKWVSTDRKMKPLFSRKKRHIGNG